jgi:hypothetical protein
VKGIGIEELIYSLSTITKDISIKYSSVTGKFYLSLPEVEIKNDGFLSNVGGHYDSIYDAVKEAFYELIEAKTIVVNAYRDYRAEYTYKNGVFMRIN